MLSLAPTLDPTEVKRAYFASLTRHPPHSDPEGFRQLRTAYEALLRPGGLAAAYASAPFEAQRALEAYRQRFDLAIERAGEVARAQAQAEDSEARFFQQIGRASWAEAIEACGPKPAEPSTPTGAR